MLVVMTDTTTSPLQRYRVTDLNREDRSIALRDGAGVFHAARSTGDMPELGDTLEGRPACLGSAILTGRGEQAFTVIFDLVDVARQDAWDRLHAPLTP